MSAKSKIMRHLKKQTTTSESQHTWKKKKGCWGVPNNYSIEIMKNTYKSITQNSNNLKKDVKDKNMYQKPYWSHDGRSWCYPQLQLLTWQDRAEDKVLPCHIFSILASHCTSGMANSSLIMQLKNMKVNCEGTTSVRCMDLTQDCELPQGCGEL